HEQVGNNRLAVRALESAKGNSSHRRTLPREAVERLPARAGSSEGVPLQESCFVQLPQAAIHARIGAKACNDPSLLAIRDPHDGQLAQITQLAFLNDGQALPVIASHGWPRSKGFPPVPGVSQFPARYGRAPVRART